MDIEVWWEVVLRLFPEGAPVPYGTTLLDHVFSALWLSKICHGLAVKVSRHEQCMSQCRKTHLVEAGMPLIAA